MYRFEKTANHRMLAVALVAMLAVCSFACVFSDETDAAYDQSFDINMRVGDQFSYTPQVNLSDATIGTPTGTAMSNGLSWSGGTLSGSFATATGSASANQSVIQADWTNGSLSQTAKQTINFYVYDKIAFTAASGSSSYTIQDLTASKPITTASVQSLQYPATPTMTHQITKDSGADNGLFTVDDNTGAITTARAADDGDEGTYVITVTASYSGDGGHTSGGTVTDSAIFTYTITVGADMTVQSDKNPLETYVSNPNGDQNQFTVTTNYPDADITFSQTNTSGVDGLVSIDGTSGVVTINASASGIGATAETPKEFDITVTATGNIDDDPESESASVTVHVKIFAELVFISEPEIDNVSALSATGNALDTLATATFTGAKSVTYNWGDGTQTHVDVRNGSNPTYSARHVYDSAGVYRITVTAENDRGVQKAYMLYDATNGQWAASDEDAGADDGQQGFFEEHGYLFILFAVLALLMVFLFFGMGIQHPFVAIAAIAFVILAVLCFVYDDFGLLDGFLNKES